jgi:hypothetical protein
LNFIRRLLKLPSQLLKITHSLQKIMLKRKRVRNPPFQCWTVEIKCDAMGKPSALAL